MTELLLCRATSTSNLLYVKEDLIIPQTISFYDLIISQARGKSGPLFHFDVHDDIRVQHDATKEKDDSHAGGNSEMLALAEIAKIAYPYKNRLCCQHWSVGKPPSCYS